jgi:tetratricopeptide (TPR) repeat protein
LTLAGSYGAVRRYPEALASVDRVLAFEPTNTPALGLKALLSWSTGDLPAVEPLLANPGIQSEVRGVQALVKRRYPEAIEVFSKALAEGPVEERRELAVMLGLTQQRAGNLAAARAIFQKASQDLERELQTLPTGSVAEADLRGVLARAYAGLGDAKSAVAEGQKAMALDATSKDPFEGLQREAAMAQIYALLGDADHAIPLIRRMLKAPVGLEITPALLRIEPIWDAIRNDPRFPELCQDKQP